MRSIQLVAYLQMFDSTETTEFMACFIPCRLVEVHGCTYFGSYLSGISTGSVCETASAGGVLHSYHEVLIKSLGTRCTASTNVWQIKSNFKWPLCRTSKTLFRSFCANALSVPIFGSTPSMLPSKKANIPTSKYILYPWSGYIWPWWFFSSQFRTPLNRF